jgi:hypothetical protein
MKRRLINGSVAAVTCLVIGAVITAQICARAIVGVGGMSRQSVEWRVWGNGWTISFAVAAVVSAIVIILTKPDNKRPT